MRKEKQIEEICKILTEAAHKACEDMPFAPPSPDDRCIRPNMECHRCKEARALIAAGYRKQIEGEWKPIMTVCNRGECTKCGEIGAVRWKYCPNCGAKMRKEEEGK